MNLKIKWGTSLLGVLILVFGFVLLPTEFWANCIIEEKGCTTTMEGLCYIIICLILISLPHAINSEEKKNGYRKDE